MGTFTLIFSRYWSSGTTTPSCLLHTGNVSFPSFNGLFYFIYSLSQCTNNKCTWLKRDRIIVTNECRSDRLSCYSTELLRETLDHCFQSSLNQTVTVLKASTYDSWFLNRYFFRKWGLLDHEIALKILEFVFDSKEKVKSVFLLSPLCIFYESNGTKS